MSSGDGELETNTEGALWRLLPHWPARLGSGFLKLKCSLESRTGAHPMVTWHPLPFRPYKFILSAEEEGLNSPPHAIVSKTSTRNPKLATLFLDHECLLQGILAQNTLGPRTVRLGYGDHASW